MHSMLNLEVGELKQQTPHNQLPLLSAQKKTQRILFTRDRRKRTVKNWKKICLVW